MLSVVITARNEEKNIARAISSAVAIADEIIVVDTQSLDKTVEIAKKMGAKIFHHKNTGIVEPVRNFSISKAKGDWVLLLDADEEIPETLASVIKKLTSLEDGQISFYRIPRRNIIFNKWVQSAHWWPDYVYRLFKKGAVSWDDAIHSIPLTRGVGRDLPADESHALIHHNYDSISQYIDRLNRYTDHQLTILQSKGHNFDWSDVLKKPFAEFLTQYFARKGYTQGFHGLVLSLLQAISELVLYLKLWETSGFVEQTVHAKDLTSEFKTFKSQFNWWLYQSKIDQANFLVKPVLKLLRKLA